ncbi:hypothetical protein [Pseudomonas sp.]|uniref:hypothetical protein n=1 Tax=Pseudomonas sp. TaxID=306 RepID=UPI002D1371D0|nr:hypothetical protein [Pseudomonas sp.]HUE93071.1 hypothetical protein [Pseudomonas sp.]
MSGFWHAALRVLGAGAVSAFVFSQCYSAILNSELLEGVLPWQRFTLLLIIVIAVFVFCFLLLGYGLRLVKREAGTGGRVIVVEDSTVGGDVVGGDKVSYKDRP